MLVAEMLAGFRRGRVGVVAFEPAGHVEEIDLLAPEHAGEGLALDAFFVFTGLRGVDGGVEVVGFLLAERDDLVDGLEGAHLRRGRETQAQDVRTMRGYQNFVIDAGLGAGERRVDTRFTLNEVAVEGVFDERLAARRVVKAFGVRLVVGEEWAAAGGGVEVALAE